MVDFPMGMRVHFDVTIFFSAGFTCRSSASQFSAAAAHAHHLPAVLDLGLGEAGVGVAADGDRDFGHVAQHLVLFRRIEMPEQNDDVRARADLESVAAHGFHHRQGVPWADVVGRLETAEIHGHRADHRHAQAAGVENFERRGRGLATGIDEIRHQKGEPRGAKVLADHPPAVVVLVIAQGGGVDAQQIRDFNHGHAAKDRRDGGSLDEIAGAQDQARAATGLLAADGGGQVGDAAGAVGLGLQLRVQVVEVKDGQRLRLGLGGDEDGCEEKEEPAEGFGVAFLKHSIEGRAACGAVMRAAASSTARTFSSGVP